MKSGDQVRHPSLGAGMIVAVRTRGGQAGAYVDFGYMTAWAPASELGLDAGSNLPHHDPGANTSSVEPSIFPSLTDRVVEARRGVLAMKLGQVLEEHVLQLSIGTESVRAKLEVVVARALQRHACGVLVKGAWGSGKTHLLTMLRAIATSNRMATSSVILDGEGVRLSDPMRLMEGILESLRYPGEAMPCGIGSRLRQLRRSRVSWNARSQGATRLAYAIDVVPERAFDEPEILGILEDYFMLSLPATQARTALARRGYRGVPLPPMATRNVISRPVRFREHLEGWTEFVTQTGASGLVLILDEVDVEYASTAGRGATQMAERWRRQRLLSALSVALGRKLPLVVAFGSAPADGEVEEQDDAVRDLARAMGESPLTIIQAPEPDLPHMRQLAQRVIDLYGRGHAERLINVDRSLMSTLRDRLVERYMENAINPVPRALVRRTLECLDVLPDVLTQERRPGANRRPHSPPR